MGENQATTATVGSVISLLDSYFPPGLAESWDRVGLAVGDPSAPVDKVAFAVDPVLAVVDEACSWGAQLLVTHHPLLLRPVSSVAASTPKGAVVHRLIAGGCALYTAHTNADAAPGGVADTLASLLGLQDATPLVPAPGEAMDKYGVFVPTTHTDAVLDAMFQAGAGQLGAYQEAAWQVAGIGRFTPMPGAHPYLGRVGAKERVPEDRVELIAARSARAAVVHAMRAAHPYEEPAFDVVEIAPLPSGFGIGRVGMLAQRATLRDFARQVADILPATQHGVRVAGDPEAHVQRVAVVGGAGDSLLDQVRASKADVYVTADLRHHPALEAREQAEVSAAGKPYLVDVSHAASEWPWLAGVARRLGADLAAQGITVDTRVSTRSTDPWTFRLG